MASIIDQWEMLSVRGAAPPREFRQSASGYRGLLVIVLSARLTASCETLASNAKAQAGGARGQRWAPSTCMESASVCEAIAAAALCA
jgi:hypothetical protein